MNEARKQAARQPGRTSVPASADPDRLNHCWLGRLSKTWRILLFRLPRGSTTFSEARTRARALGSGFRRGGSKARLARIDARQPDERAFFEDSREPSCVSQRSIAAGSWTYERKP